MVARSAPDGGWPRMASNRVRMKESISNISPLIHPNFFFTKYSIYADDMLFMRRLYKLNSLGWTSVLILSTSLLLLRLIDFIDEASRMDFHMTRIGLKIHGNEAMVLQVLIILLISFGIIKASAKLFSHKPQLK